jgi:hypothetical protein
MGRSGGCVGQATAAIGSLTLRQLNEWGFVYDEIYFGKPDADIFIDDKARGFSGELDCNLVPRIIKSTEIARQGQTLSQKTSAVLLSVKNL